jgi:aminoglycoside 6'-N-acetyltransferase I
MTDAILDLDPTRTDLVEQTARLLLEAFRERTPSWPDLASALAEVHESLEPGKVSRVMVDEAGQVIGWIGGQPQYDGHVWELHPLVVAEAWRGRGFGRALVADLERQVAERGGLTLWLGADDENVETSLGGVDLYGDVPGALQRAAGRRPHPLGFYARLGFTLVGVLPDANGRGKPDIFLAKRIEPVRALPAGSTEGNAGCSG